MDTGKDRDTMRIQSQVLQGFDGACVWATGGGYDDASHGVSRHFQQVIRINNIRNIRSFRGNVGMNIHLSIFFGCFLRLFCANSSAIIRKRYQSAKTSKLRYVKSAF
jgi:hypothetical protein